MIPGGLNPMLLSAGGSSGYQLQRSLRLRASASAFLNRTFGTPTNNLRWSWSGWVKWGDLTAVTQVITSSFNTISDSLIIYFSGGYLVVGSYSFTHVQTTAVFRDPSAWYHICFVVDTTQATASNRMKLYVNGVEITSFSTFNPPGQGIGGAFNYSGYTCRIGQGGGSPPYHLDGYLSDVHFIDGQALTPSAFGQFDTNGNWQAKPYTGTYGANGFKLDFSDNTSTTNLMLDRSGNGNNWTANNISLTAGATYDAMLDVPLGGGGGGGERGNYATLNPILPGRSDNGGAAWSSRDGNLYGANANGGGGWATMGSTISIPSGAGVFYFECTVGATGQTMGVGVQKTGTPFAATFILGNTGDSNGYSYVNDGSKGNNGLVAYGSAAAAGVVIGVLVDASGGTSSITFFNGTTSMGVAFSGITGDLTPALSTVSGAGNCAINFGQRPFTNKAVNAPSAKALHTGNLTSDAVTVSESFTGNAVVDGPFVWMNGAPETLTINGNAVTWGTHADKTAGGFKLRTSSASHNASGTNTWTATVLTPSSNSAFRKQLAKSN